MGAEPPSSESRLSFPALVCLLCAAHVPVFWWQVLGLLQRELGVGVVSAWASAEGDLCSDG